METDYLGCIIKGLFKGVCWLLDAQAPNGSWGKTKGVGNDIFSTYLCVWALSELGLLSSSRVKNALHWFQKYRNKDGGWGYRLSKQSTIDQTARGLISLSRAGLIDQKFVNAIEQIILKTQNSDGSWSREIGEEFEPEVLLPLGIGDVGATLPIVTLLSAVRSRIPSREIDEALNNATNWLKVNCNEDGGWGFHGKGFSNPLATAWALRALRDAGTPCEDPTISRGCCYLKEKQLEDGSWGRENEGSIIYTYNSVHSLILCGFSIYSPEVKAGIRWLLEKQLHDGSWGEKGTGTTRYTGSLVLVLSRALKSNPDTLPYCFLIGSSVETRTVQLPVTTLSKRLNIRATRNAIIFFVVLFGGLYVLGFFTSQLIAFWQSLPLSQKTFIVTGIIVAILLNLFSTFLFNILSQIWRAVSKFLGSKK